MYAHLASCVYEFLFVSALCMCRESEVEHFGKFLTAMRESVSKVRAKFIDHCNQMSGRKYVTNARGHMHWHTHACIGQHMHVFVNTQHVEVCVCVCVCVCTHQFFAAFSAEFHKMAAVVNGLAQCFAIENKECKTPAHTHTHTLSLSLSHTHTHTNTHSFTYLLTYMYVHVHCIHTVTFTDSHT